jgi:hypothetical protein
METINTTSVKTLNDFQTAYTVWKKGTGIVDTRGKLIDRLGEEIDELKEVGGQGSVKIAQEAADVFIFAGALGQLLGGRISEVLSNGKVINTFGDLDNQVVAIKGGRRLPSSAIEQAILNLREHHALLNEDEVEMKTVGSILLGSGLIIGALGMKTGDIILGKQKRNEIKYPPPFFAPDNLEKCGLTIQGAINFCRRTWLPQLDANYTKG